MPKTLLWLRTLSILLVFVLVSGNSITKDAKADWRKDIGIFRIGIIMSDKSIEALDRLEPFKLAISEALNMDVEFFRANSATTLMNALSDERIEYAIFSASAYALAWASCECVEPVVISRSKDSTDGYHTILISAPGGPLSLKDLKGHKIGVLSENSITGPALVSHLLSKQNIIIGDDETPFVTQGTGEKTLAAFVKGDFKVLIGWSSMTGNPSNGYSRGSLKQLSEKFDATVRDHKVLWKSEQIPHRAHVMRKKIHGDAKKILHTTLLNLYKKDPVAYDTIEPVYGGGFVTGRHERFAQLIDLMQAQDEEIKTAEEIPPLQ